VVWATEVFAADFAALYRPYDGAMSEAVALKVGRLEAKPITAVANEE